MYKGVKCRMKTILIFLLGVSIGMPAGIKFGDYWERRQEVNGFADIVIESYGVK